jgi:hypothetical protein
MGMEGGAHGTPDDDFFGKDDGLEDDEAVELVSNAAGKFTSRVEEDEGGLVNDGINFNPPNTLDEYNPFA